jgi:hypothetical protein
MLSRQRISAVIQRGANMLNERIVRPAVSGNDGVRRLRSDTIVAVVQSADLWNGDDAPA